MKTFFDTFATCAAVAAVSFLCAAGCSKTSKLERHISRADGYFAEADYAKAEIEYRNALRLSPSNTYAMGRIGTIFLEVGQIPQAFMALARVSQLEPTNLSLRVKFGQVCLAGRLTAKARAEALYVLGRDPKFKDAALLLVDSSATTNELADAATRIQGFLKTSGESAEYRLALGGLAFRKRDTNTAEVEFTRALSLDPNSASAHMAMGNIWLVKGDLKRAEESYKRGHDLSGVRSPIRIRFADFKLSNGEPKEAKAVIDAILKEVPDHVPALSFLANMAYGESDWEECGNLLRRVLLRDPTNLDGMLMRAKVSFRKGERDRSLKESIQLSALYPKSPAVQYQLGLAYLGTGDTDKAVIALNEAVTADPNYAEAVVLLSEIRLRRNDHASAVIALTQLVKNRPDYLPAHFALASAHLARKAPDEAAAIYRNIMRAVPKGAQAPVLLGSIYRQQRKPAEARQAFEVAVQVGTNQPQYYLAAMENLVELDIEQRQPAQALQRLAPFSQSTTNSPMSRYLTAKAHMAMTNFAAAEKELHAAIEADPNYRPAFLLLSGLYSTTKRGDESIRSLEALTKLRTNDWAAHLLLASVHQQNGRLEKAQEQYEKVVAINPSQVVALNNLAGMYLETDGKLDRALDFATRARAVSRNDPFTADTLGWVQFKRKEYDQALELIQESARALPLDPEVQYHLGMVHYRLGEELPARAALEKSVQSARTFTGKEEAKQVLAALVLEPNAGDPKALSELEKLVDRDPSDLIAVTRLGKHWETTGQHERAAKVYEKTLKANPKSPIASVRLASLYSGPLKNPKRAVEIARESRKQFPRDNASGLTFARIATSTSEAEDHRWALTVLQGIAATSASQPEVMFEFAVAQFLNGQTAPAEQSMKTAVAQGASGAFSRVEEARAFLTCLSAIRDPKQALTSAGVIQDLLNRQPDHPAALVAAATVYSQKGQHPVAAQALEKALKRAPLCAVAAARLAVVNADYLGNDARALELGLGARTALPDDVDLAASLGRASFRRNEFAQAARLLRDVTSRRPKDAEAFYYLGLSHGKVNQKREAREALQKALQLDAKSKFATEAKKMLSDLDKG